MINYSNPFLQSLGNIRTLPQQNQFTQPQNQFNQPQNQYDFSGWGDRLGKIEEGIAGLTKQFNSFQKPGDVAPENTGNAAPEPLEQPANAPEPLGGIESLAPPQDTGFNFDPQGGSLFSQLSSAYGQPATMQDQFNQDNPNYVSQAVAMGHAEPGTPHYIRGGGDYTQGFQDFVQNQGYYVDPTKSYLDGGMNISETPIDLPFRGPRQENIPQTDAGWGPQQLLGLGGGRERPGWTGQPKPNTNFQPHSGIPRPNPEWLAGLGPLRPNDQMQPIGGLTQPQQQQALQVGLGALQGPTQQKIQQGLGSLGAGI